MNQGWYKKYDLFGLPAATPWQTTLTTPCWASSTITSSSSLVRAEPERRRPPRRFCSIMPSAVRAPLCSTQSGTKCSCPTPSSRSDRFLWHHCKDKPEKQDMLTLIILCDVVVFVCFFSAGFWERQNTEKRQLKSVWEVYGHSVRQWGKRQVADSHKCPQEQF